jgi:hypothetical protein
MRRGTKIWKKQGAGRGELREERPDWTLDNEFSFETYSFSEGGCTKSQVLKRPYVHALYQKSI